MRSNSLIKLFFLVLCHLFTVVACHTRDVKTLPILGHRDVKELLDSDGKKYVDTIYHIIPPFRFVDQDSSAITSNDVKGKIYVADFFFTRCPTICPVLAKNLLQIAQKYADQKDFLILSHTIDAKYDSLPSYSNMGKSSEHP